MTQWVILGVGSLVTLTLAFVAAVRLRTRRMHCAKCGYDVRHTASATCPECGCDVEHAARTKRRRRTRIAIGAGVVAALTPTVMWSQRHGWSPPLPAYKYLDSKPLQDGAVVSVFVARDPALIEHVRVVLRGADGSFAQGAFEEIWCLSDSGKLASYGYEYRSLPLGRVIAIVLWKDVDDTSRPTSAEVVTIDEHGSIRPFLNRCWPEIETMTKGTSQVPRLLVADAKLQALSGGSQAYTCPAIFVWDGKQFQLDEGSSTAAAGWRTASVQAKLSWLRLDDRSDRHDIAALSAEVGCLLMAGETKGAWELFEAAWPDSVPGKQAQRAKLEEVIRTSSLAKLIKYHRDNTAQLGNTP